MYQIMILLEKILHFLKLNGVFAETQVKVKVSHSLIAVGAVPGLGIQILKYEQIALHAVSLLLHIEDPRYNDSVCYQRFCCYIKFAVIKKLHIDPSKV